MGKDVKKTDSHKRIKPLVEYYKEYGNIANIKQNQEYMVDGECVKIGWIIANLRQDKKKGVLAEDIIELLDYMGMQWDGNNLFEEKKKILLAWYMENKTLANLTQYSTLQYGGEVVDIGKILLGIRKDKKKGLLTDAQIELLESLGIVWAPKDKETAFHSLVKYKEMHGTIAHIKSNDVFEVGGKGVLVGRQINNLRTKYNKGLLSEEEIKYFESLGIVWGKSSSQKHDKEM